MSTTRLDVLQKVIQELEKTSDGYWVFERFPKTIGALEQSIQILQRVDSSSPLFYEKDHTIEQLIENAYNLLRDNETSKEIEASRGREKIWKMIQNNFRSNLVTPKLGISLGMSECVQEIEKLYENLVLKENLIKLVNSNDPRMSLAKSAVYDLIHYSSHPSTLEATYEFLKNPDAAGAILKYNNAVNNAIQFEHENRERVKNNVMWIAASFVAPPLLILHVTAAVFIGIACLFSAEIRAIVKSSFRELKHQYAEYEHQKDRIDYYQELQTQQSKNGSAFFNFSGDSQKSSEQLHSVREKNPLLSSRVDLNDNGELVKKRHLRKST